MLLGVVIIYLFLAKGMNPAHLTGEAAIQVTEVALGMRS